ncbi:hypothetical protein ACWDA7_26110 [Streptomyces sp. NPDC001156]
MAGASLVTGERRPAANSGTYLYRVVPETPSNFAIDRTGPFAHATTWMSWRWGPAWPVPRLPYPAPIDG